MPLTIENDVIQVDKSGEKSVFVTFQQTAEALCESSVWNGARDWTRVCRVSNTCTVGTGR